jgi:hypothetical protein
MGNTLTKNIASATCAILRPLVRILLRNGVPFQSFADLAKWTYVDIAMRESGIDNKKPTISRASILTGLSRKEVSRLWKMETPKDEVAIERYNRAARVIGGWINDPRFTDNNGDPQDLFIENGQPNFSELVKSYSGDAPSRAILDELKRVGVVEPMGDKKIHLLKRAYVPHNDEAGLLNILGTDVSHLIKTIDHNIVAKDDDPFFQRRVSYNNLPAEALEGFRQTINEEGQQLLEVLNKQMAGHDRDTNPSSQGSGRYVAGVGIYYFEEQFSGAELGQGYEKG